MRIARWTLVALLSLVGIAVLALLVLQTAWAKDRLRTFAVERANRLLQGQLSIGTLEGSLLSGVVLNDVVLTQDGMPVIEASQVELRYNLVTLARRGLVLSSVTLRDPHVRVVQTSSGWNVTRLTRPSEQPSRPPMAFAINRVTVVGGSVDIRPLTLRPRALRDVRLDATIERQPDGVAMRIGHLTGREQSTGYVIEALEGEFVRSFADIRTSFVVTGSPSRASGELSMRSDGIRRTIESTVDVVELDLQSILETPRWASKITGRATVHGTLGPAGTPPALAFAFAGPHARALGYEGTQIAVGGALERGLLRFAGSANAYGAHVTTDARWRFADAAEGDKAGLTATGRFEGAQLVNLPPQLALPRFETDLDGDYRVHTDDGGWAADVRLDASQFEEAQLSAGTTGHVESHGGVARYQAQGHVAGLDVQRLSAPLDLTILAEDRFESRITGDFTVEGTSAGPTRRQLIATALLTDSAVGGATFEQMALDVELDGRRLTVKAAGDFHNLTPELAGLETSVPVVLNGLSDAEFTLHDISAPVTTESIDVRGRVTLAPSSARGLEVEGVVDGDLTGGVATIRTLRLDAAGLHLGADGTVALGSRGESALHVTAAADDLSVAGHAFGLPLAGGADVTADVTGPAIAPTVDGTVNARALTYGPASALSVSGTFSGTLPDRNIEFVNGTSTVKATFVKVGGTEIVRLAATAAYDQRQVSLETRIEQENRTLDAVGVVSIQPDRRDIVLRRFTIDTAGTAWALPPGQEARIGVANDRAHIDHLVLARGDQSIQLNGDIAFGEGASADDPPLTIRAERVQLADVNQMLMSDRRIAGLLNATATVAGPIRTPDVSAEFLIVNGAIEQMPFNAARGTVRYAESVAMVDAELQQTSTHRLTISGHVATESATSVPPGIDIRVASTPIDLGFVQGFTTVVQEVTGSGTFDLRVTGQTAAPLIDGTVAIDQAGFVVDPTGVRYRDLTARLAFEQNHLRIDQLLIVDDDGHQLRAEGGLDVIGRAGAERSLDVRITSDDFHVLNNEVGSLQIDSNLQAQGGFLSPMITGTLRVEQGRLEVDRILELVTSNVYSTRPQAPEDVATSPAAPELSRVGPPAQPSAVATGPTPTQAPTSGPPPDGNAPSGGAPADQPGLFSRVTLAMTLEMPDNLVLRGRDLRMADSSIGLGDVNIVAGGSLDITKDPGGETNLVGSLAVERGYYAFQGRRFDVERGSTVRFRGQTPIDPALDVTAVRVISGVDALVHVHGSMREPTIALSSRPPLDDADVLSLIVFGQQINELGATERTSLSERVASMAAGAVASPIADSVARALNLDLFEIQAPSGSNAPTVSLGSQIGDRLYVGVRQEVGRGDRRQLSVEYRLSDVLRLVTSVAQGSAEQHADRRNEAGGVDLIFEKRY